MVDSEGLGFVHGGLVVEVPGFVVDFEGEVSGQVVDNPAGGVHVGGICVDVSNHVAHPQCRSLNGRQINRANNTDLAVSWQLIKRSDYPRVGVLNYAPYITFYVGSWLPSRVSLELGSQRDN